MEHYHLVGEINPGHSQITSYVWDQGASEEEIDHETEKKEQLH